MARNSHSIRHDAVAKTTSCCSRRCGSRVIVRWLALVCVFPVAALWAFAAVTKLRSSRQYANFITKQPVPPPPTVPFLAAHGAAAAIGKPDKFPDRTSVRRLRVTIAHRRDTDDDGPAIPRKTGTGNGAPRRQLQFQPALDDGNEKDEVYHPALALPRTPASIVQPGQQSVPEPAAPLAKPSSQPEAPTLSPHVVTEGVLARTPQPLPSQAKGLIAPQAGERPLTADPPLTAATPSLTPVPPRSREATAEVEALRTRLALDGMDALGVRLVLSVDETAMQAPIASHCAPTLKGGRFTEADSVALRRSGSTEMGPSLRDIRAGIVPGVTMVATVKLAQDMDDSLLLNRTNMLPLSLATFCSNRSKFGADHVPLGGCPGAEPSDGCCTPHNGVRWCAPPAEALYLLAVECGIVDNYVGAGSVMSNVVSTAGAVSTVGNSWWIAPHHPVLEYAELAVPGGVVFADTIGHFANEMLPSLLLLDKLVPLHVPLVWPDGQVTRYFLEELKNEGVLDPNRPLVMVSNKKPSLARAQRLYVLRPARRYDQAPNVAWVSQRLMQLMLTKGLHRRLSAASQAPTRADQHDSTDSASGAIGITGTGLRNGPTATLLTRLHRVVIFQRSMEPRRVSNHDQLVSAVAAALGPTFIIEEFEPSPEAGHPLWDTAARVNAACFIIGPHGANMLNVMFLEPGNPCWVVELGYSQRNPSMMPDWYCLTRNLGYTYYLSLALESGYQVPMEANIQEVAAIASLYRIHVEAIERQQKQLSASNETASDDRSVVVVTVQTVSTLPDSVPLTNIPAVQPVPEVPQLPEVPAQPVAVGLQHPSQLE